MKPFLASHPSWRYVAPFAAFLALMAAGQLLKWTPTVRYPVQVVAVSLVLFLFSADLIDLRVSRPAASVLLGLAVFLVWIGPDSLWPGHHELWFFRNPLTGAPRSTLDGSARASTLFLTFRVAGAAILVPIIEELFWRAWLMRYLIAKDFRSVPLGTYTALSFWIAALLFASEHGPYWDVGLAAGVAYNWWMIRTRSLGDCILAHAVTNACLVVYVLTAGKWEYWL